MLLPAVSQAVGENTGRSVLNNAELLNATPGFKALIEEIGRADGLIALEILDVLLRADTYVGQNELPLLPAEQTTLTGPSAQAQLAVYDHGELTLSPRFFGYADAAYLLVHEALHGALVTDSGPFHHQHVRNIARYLKQNRGHYVGSEFVSFLVKNGFVYRERQTLFPPEEFFARGTTDTDRCDYLEQSFYRDEVQAAKLFFKLQCRR